MSEPDFSIAPSGIVRLRWLGWEQEMKDTSRQGVEIGATLSQRVRAKELAGLKESSRHLANEFRS